MILPEIGEATFKATHTVTTHEVCYFHEAEKKVNAERFRIAQVESRAPNGKLFPSVHGGQFRARSDARGCQN